MTIDYDLYHQHGRTAAFDDIYERVRLRRVASVLRSRAWRTSAQTLLDVGSGEGRYLPVWRSLFPRSQLTAVEYCQIATARSAARYPFARHVTASGESLPVAAASVDVVVSIDVLEHVPQPDEMLSECYRVLKPDGWALISTPCGNRGSLEWWINASRGELRKVDGDGILFGSTDDPTHLRRYRSTELMRRCRGLGFEACNVYFSGHLFETLCSRFEQFFKGHINLQRRSQVLADGFDRALDRIGLLDWWLMKRVPCAATMVVLLRKPSPAASSMVDSAAALAETGCTG